MILKAGTWKWAVLIEYDKQIYQICLTPEQSDRLIAVLPQLYDDGVIKILPEPLDLNFKKDLK